MKLFSTRKLTIPLLAAGGVLANALNTPNIPNILESIKPLLSLEPSSRFPAQTSSTSRFVLPTTNTTGQTPLVCGVGFTYCGHILRDNNYYNKQDILTAYCAGHNDNCVNGKTRTDPFQALYICLPVSPEPFEAWTGSYPKGTASTTMPLERDEHRRASDPIVTAHRRRHHLPPKRRFGPIAPISEDEPWLLSVQPNLVQEMMSNSSTTATAVSETPTSLVIIPVPSFPRPQGTPGTTQGIPTSTAQSHNTAYTPSDPSGQWTIIPSRSSTPSPASTSPLFVTQPTLSTNQPSSFVSVTIPSWSSSDNGSDISSSSTIVSNNSTAVFPSLTSPPTPNHNSPAQACNTTSSSKPTPAPGNRIELLCACGVQCLDPSGDHIGRCEGACFS
ncbi:hypothetical protein B0J18DRAFT_424901 [Chaetomium sp. MPI-SDFR-AT-0129]|nr:hypothetical protein B0J18DRAFT_424901 [Chaetomium sp. MPI-SDFR-AT-0129]